MMGTPALPAHIEMTTNDAYIHRELIGSNPNNGVSCTWHQAVIYIVAGATVPRNLWWYHLDIKSFTQNVLKSKILYNKMLLWKYIWG